MFKLHAIQAEFGDCLLIEHGTEAHPHHVLIDGGPQLNYKAHLRGVLKSVAQKGGALDLVILSHVDTDHILGLVDFFAEERDRKSAGDQPLIAVGGLWHNSFDRAIDINNTIAPKFMAAINAAGQSANQITSTGIALQGIGDGNTLRVLALQLGIPLNDGFTEIITTETAPDDVDLNGLNLRVVGPTPANLEALRAEWEKWLADHEDAITSADPLLMANADQSVPNLSSISVVAGVGGKTILLTGDARSDHVLEGLKTAGLTDDDGNMHVDVLKLPHHGSDRNMTKTFFRKVTADRYVVSANGKDGNPDVATLIWLVESASAADRKIEIIATNATPSTQKLQNEYPESEYGYTLTIMPKNQHFITVDLS